ncbi:MAG TPA: tetratricopeptide repeat protein [Elusimicrobiota bacterium]|nr:tetratricopeptide repeat protein [Elusimicrobiota bacterium]
MKKIAGPALAALLLAGALSPARAGFWSFLLPRPKTPGVAEEAAFESAAQMFQATNTDKLAVVQALQKYLQNFPDSPHTDDATFLEGQSYLEYALAILKSENASKQKSMERALEPQNPVATQALDNAKKAFEAVAQDRGSDLASSAQYRLGETAYDGQHWNEAVLNFQKVSKSFPKSYIVAESLIGIVDADLAQDDFPDAEANLFLLGETFPNYLKEPDVVYAEGIVALQKGDYDTAERMFKSLDSAEAEYYLGKTHILANKPFLAAADFERLLSEHPQSDLAPQARFFLGDSFFLANDYDGAIEKYQDFLAKYPDNPLRVSAMFRLGSCYFEKKDFVQARANFQAVLDRYPHDFFAPLAQYFIAESYLTAGQLRQALFAYSKAITEYPEDIRISPLARFKLAWTQYQVGDMDEAVQTCQNFLSLYPTDALAKDVYLILGNSLIKLGRHSEAADAFQRILDLAPASDVAEQALFSILQDQYNQKSYASILTSYQYLLRRMPPSNSRWRSLSYLYAAEAYLDLGQADQAQRLYEMILKVYPNDPAALYAQDGLAWCYSYKGDDADAIAARNKLKDMIAASGSTTAFALNGLGLADSLFNQGNYDQAYQLYSQFAASEPKNPQVPAALYRAGLSLYHEHYYSDAITQWQKLIAAYPKSPEAVKAAYEAADTLFRAQKYPEATAAYRQIISDYPDSPQISTAYLRIAQASFNGKNDNDAVSQIQDFLKRFPNSSEVDDALDLLEAIFDRNPKMDYQSTLRGLTVSGSTTAVATDAQFRLGRRCFEQKDYACATTELQKFSVEYTDDPKLPEAQFLLGESDVQQNEPDLAVAAYQRLLNNFPADQNTPLALFHLAGAFYGEKNYAQAANYYGQLAEQYPKSEYLKPAEFNLALADKALGRLDEAQAAYDQYASLAGGAESTAAYWQIYAIQKQRHDDQDAVATLMKIKSAAAPGSQDYLEASYRLGEMYQDMGRPDAALSAWEEMRGDKPVDNPFRLQALINLAQAYEKAGNDAKAADVYDDLALSAGKPLAQQAAARAKALRKMADSPAASKSSGDQPGQGDGGSGGGADARQ